MQLTSPFYEELTVRENLTLAAQLRLPGSMTTTDRFDRVEKVLYEVSLKNMLHFVGANKASSIEVYDLWDVSLAQ